MSLRAPQATTPTNRCAPRLDASAASETGDVRSVGDRTASRTDNEARSFGISLLGGPRLEGVRDTRERHKDGGIGAVVFRQRVPHRSQVVLQAHSGVSLLGGPREYLTGVSPLSLLDG